VANVIDELRRDVTAGIHKFRFCDSSLTTNADLAPLCGAIRSELPDIRWSAFARLNEVSVDLAAAMRGAGCRILFVGIESGSPRVLELIKKGLTPSQMAERCRILRESGIQIAGSFIVGLPGETEDDIKQTIAFAASLDLQVYSWHVFCPSLESVDKAGEGQAAGFRWKDFRADVPHHLVRETLRSAPAILVDRHTVPELVLAGDDLGKMLQERIPFSSFTYAEAYRWIGEAMRATKMTEDFDELRILSSAS
jgi:hypothetical protein